MTTDKNVNEKVSNYLLDYNFLEMFNLREYNSEDYPLDESYAEIIEDRPDLFEDDYLLDSIVDRIVRTLKVRMLKDLLKVYTLLESNQVKSISPVDLQKRIDGDYKIWLSGDTDKFSFEELNKLAQHNNVYVDSSFFSLNGVVDNIVPKDTVIIFPKDFKLNLDFYGVGVERYLVENDKPTAHILLKLIPSILPEYINQFELFTLC